MKKNNNTKEGQFYIEGNMSAKIEGKEGDTTLIFVRENNNIDGTTKSFTVGRIRDSHPVDENNGRERPKTFKKYSVHNYKFDSTEDNGVSQDNNEILSVEYADDKPYKTHSSHILPINNNEKEKLSQIIKNNPDFNEKNKKAVHYNVENQVRVFCETLVNKLFDNCQKSIKKRADFQGKKLAQLITDYTHYLYQFEPVNDQTLTKITNYEKKQLIEKLFKLYKEISAFNHVVDEYYQFQSHPNIISKNGITYNKAYEFEIKFEEIIEDMDTLLGKVKHNSEILKKELNRVKNGRKQSIKPILSRFKPKKGLVMVDSLNGKSHLDHETVKKLIINCIKQQKNRNHKIYSNYKKQKEKGEESNEKNEVGIDNKLFTNHTGECSLKPFTKPTIKEEENMMIKSLLKLKTNIKIAKKNNNLGF